MLSRIAHSFMFIPFLISLGDTFFTFLSLNYDIYIKFSTSPLILI